MDEQETARNIVTAARGEPRAGFRENLLLDIDAELTGEPRAAKPSHSDGPPRRTRWIAMAAAAALVAVGGGVLLVASKDEAAEITGTLGEAPATQEPNAEAVDAPTRAEIEAAVPLETAQVLAEGFAARYGVDADGVWVVTMTLNEIRDVFGQDIATDPLNPHTPVAVAWATGDLTALAAAPPPGAPVPTGKLAFFVIYDNGLAYGSGLRVEDLSAGSPPWTEGALRLSSLLGD